MLGISGSRLQHLLRRDTGASFGWHLNKRRSRHAAVLLRTTSLLVKEIAAKAGFKNTLSLERHFRAFFGCTPSQYRNQSRD
jgi:AraC-like DNA-binding protein